MEESAKSKAVLYDLDEEVPLNLNNIKLSAQSRELLSKGLHSEFLEGMVFEDGSVKNGKVKLSRAADGEIEILYHFRKEKLVIPNKIGDYQLTEHDKMRLGQNKLSGPIPYRNQNIYLQVDPELNSIVVKTQNELIISDIIEAKFARDGEFALANNKLTPEMVKALLAGKELPNMVYYNAETDQHFIAKISITPDNHGIKFMSFETISAERAKELIPLLNKHIQSIDSALDTSHQIISEKQIIQDQAQNVTVDKPGKDNELEFYNALEKRDFEKLQQLSSDGFKPSDKHIETINSIDNLSSNDISRIQQIFNVEIASGKILNAETAINSATELSNTTLLKNSREQGIIPEVKDGYLEPGNSKDPDYPDLNKSQKLLDEYHKAIEGKDFKKLNELAQSGFKPDAAGFEKTLSTTHFSQEEKIAVKTIFSIEPDREVGHPRTKSVEDKGKIELEKPGTKKELQKEEQKKDTGQKTKAIMNIAERGFSNM